MGRLDTGLAREGLDNKCLLVEHKLYYVYNDTLLVNCTGCR